MGRDWVGMVRRGVRKPPRVILRRIGDEVRVEADRVLAAPRARRFGDRSLLRATGDAGAGIDGLWERIAQRPYPAYTLEAPAPGYDGLCAGDRQRVLDAAERALAHRVDLLGSGPVDLGARIDWHKDYKTGHRWPSGYAPRIDYVNPGRPSDVKFPWEVSRLQWLIPAGQAYLLTGDERYAEGARDVLDDWIGANPYAHSVNWSCTMEAALRLLSWTWFFRAFNASRPWAAPGFRSRFLRTLYLHGDFTERHIERSDVNGNHFTADAAGLVFAGLFFGQGRGPERWLATGWDLLRAELPLQVFPDGVDFEASVPYHRLVLELFLWPALYRLACGLDVPDDYRERLLAMGRFAAAYGRPDGTVPLWGDADDARALPFGGQPINDHRYLSGLVGVALGSAELKAASAGPKSEIYWALGPEAAASLPETETPAASPPSCAFNDGGFFVMRNEADHVFIDCGPVGLSGRGGHGHNDCLSFEAVLGGDWLVADSGAYLYTASFEERNRFRATASHNTPRADGEEVNRFISPSHLWTLRNDARPEVRRWQPGPDRDVFQGAHSGFRRLDPPVTPVRTFVLDHARHALVVRDDFDGAGTHRWQVPLHLAPGVSAREIEKGLLSLSARGREFLLRWLPAGEWSLAVGPCRVSPSYGVAVPAVRLEWECEGGPGCTLTICIAPADGDPPSAKDRLDGLIAAAGAACD
jgi:hypothetical protein